MFGRDLVLALTYVKLHSDDLQTVSMRSVALTVFPHSAAARERAAHAALVPLSWWESVRGVSHGGNGGQRCRWLWSSRKLQMHDGFAWDFLIPSR